MDCYKEYEEAINNLSDFCNSINELKEDKRNILSRMVYLNVISVFDAFFCPILLVRLVNNESGFNLYAEKMFPNTFRDKIRKMKENGEEGKM